MAATGTMSWYRNSPTGPLSMNNDPHNQNGTQLQSTNKFSNYAQDSSTLPSDPFGVQYYQQPQAQRQIYPGGLPAMSSSGLSMNASSYGNDLSTTTSMGVSGLGPSGSNIGTGGIPAPNDTNQTSTSASVLGNYLQAPSGSQPQTWTHPYFLPPENQAAYPYYVNSGYMAMDPNRYPGSFQGTSSVYQSYPASSFAYPTVQHDAPALPKKKSKFEPKTFTCYGYGNCRMQFTRHEHLLRHIRKHTGERPYNCHCGKAFSRLDNLRQHAHTVHQNPEDQASNQRMMESYMKAASDASAASSRERERQRERERLATLERSSPETSHQNRMSLNSGYSVDDEAKQQQQHHSQHHSSQSLSQVHPSQNGHHAAGMAYANGHEHSRKRSSNVIVYPESLSSRKPSEAAHQKTMKGRRSWTAYDNAAYVP